LSVRRIVVTVATCAGIFGALGCVHAKQKPSIQLQEAAARRNQQEIDLLNTPHFAVAVPQDAVVRVVGPQMTCSGTLIREDQVLTAHHCVVERGKRGEFTSTLVKPEQVNVELGGDYLPWGNVVARAIVAPPCGESGGRGDVAVIVLSRKLIGMETFMPRLDEPPHKGELVSPMGFGRCARSADGIRRRQREGGAIAGLATGTFDMTASVCPGDSGGPLVVRDTNEVVGVVSLSAMDTDETTRSSSVMARLDSFRLVFAHARAISEGTDESDLPPLSCDP
jgi:hypothetical protein